MPWFAVDDHLAMHPKVIGAGNAAMGLWVRAGSWCAAHLTDGRVPYDMVQALGGHRRDARRLVEMGLWTQLETGVSAPARHQRGTSTAPARHQRGMDAPLDSGVSVPCNDGRGDYLFNDWESYQQSKRQVEAKRKASRNRVARHRESRGNGVTPPVTPTVTDAVSTPAPSLPIPTSNKTTADAEPEGFADWWSIYPKKDGKKAARTAYARALKSKTDPVTVEELLTGAERYRDNPQRKPDYTKNATTWLNGGHWADEVDTRKRNQGGGRLWQE